MGANRGAAGEAVADGAAAEIARVPGRAAQRAQGDAVAAAAVRLVRACQAAAPGLFARQCARGGAEERGAEGAALEAADEAHECRVEFE